MDRKAAGAAKRHHSAAARVKRTHRLRRSSRTIRWCGALQGATLVLQRHFYVRTTLLITCSGHSATFVLPQSAPDSEVSL